RAARGGAVGRRAAQRRPPPADPRGHRALARSGDGVVVGDGPWPPGAAAGGGGQRRRPRHRRGLASEAGHVVKVGDCTLVPFGGLWFLTDADDRLVSTILDMGEGTWRARTPEGSARTVEVPAHVDDPARYVAEQIT